MQNPQSVKHYVLLLTTLSLVETSAFADPGDTLRVVALSGLHAPGTPPGTVFGSFTPSSSVQDNSGSKPVLNNAGQTAFFTNLQQSPGVVDSTNDQGVWSEGNGPLELVAREGDQAAGTAPGARYGTFINPPLMNNSGQVAFYGTMIQGSGGVTSGNDRASWSNVGGPLHVVAREGDPAADAPAGDVFRGVGAWGLNDAGQTAISGSATPPSGDNYTYDGQWRADASGTIHAVALEGAPAPGLAAGSRFWQIDSSVMNSAGEVVFFGAVLDPNGKPRNGNGVWVERGGSLQFVADAYTIAPGTSVKFNTFTLTPAINSSGYVAFQADLQELAGGPRGIWSDTGGNLHKVALAGDPAPGVEAGLQFQSFSYPVLNNANQVAFSAGLKQGNTNLPGGIWSESQGTLQLILRSGDQAPGTIPGDLFAGFGITLNGVGRIAFYGTLRTGVGDVTSSNNEGIWAQDQNGAFQLIAREGSQLDVDSGSGFDLRTIAALSIYIDTGNGDSRRSSFNDLGQLAFLATFTDGSSGIFVSNAAAVPEPCAVAMAGLLLIPAMMTARSRKISRCYSGL